MGIKGMKKPPTSRLEAYISDRIYNITLSYFVKVMDKNLLASYFQYIEAFFR